MHARLLTFTGNDRIDEVLVPVGGHAWPSCGRNRDSVGVAAGVDRKAKMATILTLWTSEAALSASDAAMLERREAAMVRSGATMQVEQFEQVSETFAKAPHARERPHVDPASRGADRPCEDSLRYLETELLSGLLAQPGFCAMRTLVRPPDGPGLTGLSWDDAAAMEAGRWPCCARSCPGPPRRACTSTTATASRSCSSKWTDPTLITEPDSSVSKRARPSDYVGPMPVWLSERRVRHPEGGLCPDDAL